MLTTARALQMIRLTGLLTIFVMVGLASDNQHAQAGCVNVLAQCATEAVCNGVRGSDCNAGTPSCPGQYVCGSHTNCDEDGAHPVAVWCMVEQPE